MNDKLDNIEPKECMTFDEAWEHMNKLGMTVVHLSDDEYNKLMDDIGNCESMREFDEIMDKLRSSD
jgi:hypothetical protein